MKRQLLIVVLALALPYLAAAQTTTAPPAKAATGSQPEAATVPYGSNPAAGKTFVHDGVTLYYEVYGRGEPLLIIHGNGGSIGTMAAQSRSSERLSPTWRIEPDQQRATRLIANVLR